MKPFRFGVQLSTLPAQGWADELRLIESLGYSSVFWPDHFGKQWEPVAAQAAAAAVTERLKVGSLVYGIDYRHPVVLAKAAATIQVLSGGRHEFGLGAGWMQTDYDEAGMAYDRPSVRIERLDEALQVIRGMWADEKSSFEGRHYTIREVGRAIDPPEGMAPPKILIGGGGPKVLRVAGKHADIVGVSARIPEGRILPKTVHDLAPDKIREKLGWVREGAESAGRDFEAIELNTLIFVTAVTEDPAPIREIVSKQTQLTPEEIAECCAFLTGPGSEICERLQKRREETGISYVVIQGGQREVLEQFAEAVVAPLAGS